MTLVEKNNLVLSIEKGGSWDFNKIKFVYLY